MTECSVTLKEVDIPLPCKRISDFVTPYWRDVLDWYPHWRARVEGKGGEPWPVQAYVHQVCRELEKREARPGRRATDWARRLFEHFGVDFLTPYIERYARPE